MQDFVADQLCVIYKPILQHWKKLATDAAKAAASTNLALETYYSNGLIDAGSILEVVNSEKAASLKSSWQTLQSHKMVEEEFVVRFGKDEKMKYLVIKIEAVMTEMGADAIDVSIAAAREKVCETVGARALAKASSLALAKDREPIVTKATDVIKNLRGKIPPLLLMSLTKLKGATARSAESTATAAA